MRAHRPIRNGRLASDAGYLPLEGPSGPSQWDITPNKATVVSRITPPVLGLPAVNLTPAKGAVATKIGQAAVTLGGISITAAKGTIAAKVGVPTLTLGAITVTPSKLTATTKVGVPVLSGFPVDIYPDAGSIVTTVSQAVLQHLPPTVWATQGKKPTFVFVRPRPPTQLEKEMSAMLAVYKAEAAIKEREAAAERQRLQILEMGRLQRDYNRQINPKPKERKEAKQRQLIDDAKLQKMIERAKKQTQAEIDLANKLKMAKVRAAKRKKR